MFADDIIVLITDRDVSALQRKIYRVSAKLESWYNWNYLISGTSMVWDTILGGNSG